ncbi:hypothetical protein RHGRI_025300 [Rhododendron griersonianum]|uniref:Uncharacterized protein n=1 Tax=Rhododendron griersonianum TaxID=479676 RepID=A0AAV6ITX9_9ERIC|nr:hypothetical protein RHGRI_025300 [Rhododendron griersonianum]
MEPSNLSSGDIFLASARTLEFKYLFFENAAYILTNILQLDVAPSFSCLGTSKYDPIQRRYARNCIGEVIRLVRPTDKRSCLKMEVSNFLTCQKKIGSCVLPDVVVCIVNIGPRKMLFGYLLLFYCTVMFSLVQTCLVEGCCGIDVCCCCCGVPVTVALWYITKVCQQFLAKPMIDCLLFSTPT